jgi:hypothetical protein
MAKRVIFSKQNLTLQEIADHHADLERALHFFFLPPSLAQASPAYVARFFGYTPQQIRDELEIRLGELELNSVFSILSAVEAAFQIDYHQRCQQKKKDPLSRAFRDINKTCSGRPDFDRHILDTWKQHMPNPWPRMLGDLRGAYSTVRHWIAHGRYWIAKPGRKYDFVTTYNIASAVLVSFPLIGP